MVKKQKKRKEKKEKKERKCRECGRLCNDDSNFCSSLCKLEANLRSANTLFSTDKVDADMKKARGKTGW